MVKVSKMLVADESVGALTLSYTTHDRAEAQKESEKLTVEPAPLKTSSERTPAAIESVPPTSRPS